MYMGVLDRVHIRLPYFFDKGGGEPYGDLEFGKLKIVYEDFGL